MTVCGSNAILNFDSSFFEVPCLKFSLVKIRKNMNKLKNYYFVYVNIVEVENIGAKTKLDD